MAALDLTSYDPMLKEHYANGEVQPMAFQKNKALGMMKKSRQKVAGGRDWVAPVGIQLPGGGSSTFATALAAANNVSGYAAWKVFRAKHYRLAKVDNETIQATQTGDMDAFQPAFDEFDRAMQAEANYLNYRFFRGANGAIGRIAPTTALGSTLLVLDDASGVWAVRKGDVLKLSANADGSGIRAGSVTIASPQRTAGTLTLTGTVAAGVAAAALNDYIALDGDFGLASSGLADWIPDVAPTATLFQGVDRTQEPEYLGGVRIDGTDGRTIPNLLIDAVSALDNLGADPDTAFMNPLTFGTLSKQIEGKWTTTSASGYDGRKVATIGYQGFTIVQNGHSLTIYTDRCCPVKRIYLLTWSSWTMFVAGSAPMFLQEKAGSIIKVSETSDGYEARVGEYYNFVCDTPGWNAVIILP